MDALTAPIISMESLSVLSVTTTATLLISNAEWENSTARRTVKAPRLLLLDCAGTVYLGGSGVTAANGIRYGAGDKIAIPISGPCEIYMISAGAVDVRRALGYG